jgi:hypothetical protein
LWFIPFEQPLEVELNQETANDSVEQLPSSDVRLHGTIRDERNIMAR